MTSSQAVRSPGRSRRWMQILSLTLYLLVLLLQAGLLASALLRKQAYLPYFDRDYQSVIFLATCIPLTLGLVAVLAIATSFVAQGRHRYVPIGLVAVVTPLACCLGFLWWMGAVYGAGSSRPAALLTTAGSTYRLEFATPGDPPKPSLLLLECKPSPALCREVGEITNFSLSEAFPNVELQAGIDGVTVLLGGTAIATYSDRVLRCVAGPDAALCHE
jgi:hypothetical protein